MRSLITCGLVAFIVALPLANAFAGDVPHDPEAFTGYAEAKLQPEIRTVPVSATGVLTLNIGPIKDNLSALYASCQATPEHCDAAFHQHAEDLRETLGMHH